MGLLDRIFGRKSELETDPGAPGIPISDAEAVDRYERMLRTAPQDVVEQAHVEAFERLTPAQLDLLYERFTETAAVDDERPADARPASLARTAARVERRRPGAILRTLEDTRAGETDLFFGASILDTVVWYSLISAAWSSWSLPDDVPDTPASAAPDVGDAFDLGF